MDLGPGLRIGDRFAIERRAGAGGMGTVYRARDLETGEPVAVKVLSNRRADALARFDHEARALAALRHPHIVTYVAHGVTRGGEPFLAMEWFEGEDLEKRIARGPLDPASALDLLARVADALAVVHARGILHRDIKPANLFLPDCDLARVKILDFGVARLHGATQALTHTGNAVGTPAYMAPEQARGDRSIDARADVFSLGCVLFDCLTGRPPFIAAHPMAVLAKLLFEDAPRPSELRPGLPAGIDALMARLLAKDPADRPGDAAAMREELRALDGLGPSPPSSGTTPPPSLTRHERRLVSVTLEREPTSAARRLLGNPTICVGRDRELGALEAIFDECVEDQAAHAVLVTAGAGVGKSRVRHELVRRILAKGGSLEIWTARGDSMRTGGKFGLLGQVVRRAARLFDGEPLALRQRKLAARVAMHVEPPLRGRVAEFLGEMVGTPFPAEGSVQLRAARQDAKLMGDQTRRAWVDFVQAECRARPVLLILEDLHWGDRPTVEYVDAALRFLRDQPLMVLALARPEVHELFPSLWSERALTELRLTELSRRACERLAREALGDASAAVIAEVVERSAGNAFFLEELIRAVAEGRGGAVPETVLAVMQSRLEGLEAEARRLLRAGSVFGGAFSRGAVEALLGGEAGAPLLDAQLDALEQRELIARGQEPTFRGETVFTFRHATVREAAYGMLTDEDQRLGHRLAGAWLEQAGETDATVIAGHFDRGGERGRAMDWYRRAAEQALESNDFTAALERADRAAACGAAGEALGDLDVIRAEAHRWRGELAAAERRSLAAMEALPAGSARWYDAVTTAARTGYLRDRGLLASLARELEERWSEPTATGPQVIATAWTASLLLANGAHEHAQVLASRVEPAGPRFRDDPMVSAPILRLRATRARLAGDLGGYRELIDATVRCYEEAGDARAACGQRTNAGYACNEIGAYAEAASLLRATLATAEQLGLRGPAAAAKMNLGQALCALGATGEARVMADEAASECALLGNTRTEAVTYLYLAEILRHGGDLAEAEAAARRGITILTDTPSLFPFALATLSRALLAQDRAPEALESARRACALAVALASAGAHLEAGESLVNLVHAEALEASGDHPDACSAVAFARERLLDRAARITNLTWRASFLENVPENARTLALAQQWLGPPG